MERRQKDPGAQRAVLAHMLFPLSKRFYAPRRVARTDAGRWPTSCVAKGVSAPVSPLMRYDAKRPDAVPTAKTKRPSGSRQNALGTASVATCPAGVNCPLVGSTANPAMLLWPRLPT